MQYAVNRFYALHQEAFVYHQQNYKFLSIFSDGLDQNSGLTRKLTSLFDILNLWIAKSCGSLRMTLDILTLKNHL